MSLYAVDDNGEAVEGTELKLQDNKQYVLMAHTDNDGRFCSKITIVRLQWTPRVFNHDLCTDLYIPKQPI